MPSRKGPEKGTPRLGFSIYPHGRSWWVQYLIARSRNQAAVCSLEGNTREQAIEKARAIVEAARARHARIGSRNANRNPLATYQRKIEGCSEGHRSNCARYHAKFKKYFFPLGIKDFALVERCDIEDWRDWLLKQPNRREGVGTLSKKSVAEHINWLATILRIAGRPEVCLTVERPKSTHAETVSKRKYFTPDEMDLLFKVCREQLPKFYNPFVFLAHTGCRTGEMHGIQPSDIQPRIKSVTVTGKGAKTRSLNLAGPCEPAFNAILDQMRESPRDDGLIFISGKKCWEEMRKLSALAFGADEAGKPLRLAHPHMLRHTFASFALQYWQPRWRLEELSAWLGHEDTAITFKIYRHWMSPEAPSGYQSTTVLLQSKKSRKKPTK